MLETFKLCWQLFYLFYIYEAILLIFPEEFSSKGFCNLERSKRNLFSQNLLKT